MKLLNGIFQGDPPGTVVDLGSQGSMLQAHQAMDAAVRQQVAARGWFTKVPTGRSTKGSASASWRSRSSGSSTPACGRWSSRRRCCRS